MYQTIDQHPTTRKLWADTLVKRSVITDADAESLVSAKMQALQDIFESLDPEKDLANYRPESPVPGTARHTKTAIPVERLRELNRALLTFPDRLSMFIPSCCVRSTAAAKRLTTPTPA